MTVDVCGTAHGTDASEAIVRSGAYLGHASGTSRPPAHLPVQFIDWPFSEDRPSWRDHISAVREERPRIAVAPDVDRRDPEWVIEKADALAQYADTVVVVPKTIHPSDVPDRFRVGLPFQKGFGPGGHSLEDGAEQASVDDVGGRTNTLGDFAGAGPVHVLGGNPGKQRRLRRRGIDVASVDTSLPVLYARKGRIWYEDDIQVEYPGTTLRERIEESYRQIRRAWGASVPTAIEVPEIVRLFYEDPERAREEIRYRRHRGSPIVDADRQEPRVVTQTLQQRHDEKF